MARLRSQSVSDAPFTPVTAATVAGSGFESEPTVSELRQAEAQAQRQMRRRRSGSFKKFEAEAKIATGMISLVEEYSKDKRVDGKTGASKDMLEQLLGNALPALQKVVTNATATHKRKGGDEDDDEKTPTATDPTTPTMTLKDGIRSFVKQSEERLSRADRPDLEKAAAGTAVAAGIVTAVAKYRSRSRSRSRASTAASTPPPRKLLPTVPLPLPEPHQNVYMAALSPTQHRKLQHASAAILYREPVFRRVIGSYERLVAMVEYKREHGRPSRTFGQPLKQLTKYQGIESNTTLSGRSVRIPIFLHDLTSAFKRADCSVHGILRKSPSLAKLEEVARAIDTSERGAQVDLSKLDPIMLGALFKRFLSHLPDPLLTGTLFEMFIMTTHVKEPHIRKRLMHLTLCMLPKVNRDVFEVVFVFLDWLSTYAHINVKAGNGMDLSNIAKVVAPTLLRPTHRDPHPVEIKSMVKAVLNLLEDQHILNEIPFELARALHIEAERDEPSESFLRKVEHAFHLR